MLTNPVLAAALDLAEQCIPVFPCSTETKAPLIHDWPNKASIDADEITARFANGDCLIGFPTGAQPDCDVLDIDPRNGGDKWLAENEHRLPKTRVQKTRSGGYHFYFRHAEGLRNSHNAIAPGIDVRADGGYVIYWAGHGLPVKTVSSPTLLHDELAEWPEWLLEEATKRQTTAGGSVSIERRLPPSAAAVVDLLNRMPNPLEATRDRYLQVMLAAKGCTDALAEAGTLEPEEEADIADAAVDWAERWEGYAGTDERAKWNDDWSQRDAKLAGWQTLEAVALELLPGYREECAQRGLERAQADFAATPLPEFEYRGNPNWRSMLLVTEKGAVKACVANAVIVLQHDPEWVGLFRYNEFKNTIDLTRRPPWMKSGTFTGRETRDADAIWVAYKLQTDGVPVGSELTGQAMLAIAEERAFHPVRDYLNGLVWDHQPRIDTWVIDYLGVEDTPLHRTYSAKFLIGAVARIMRPGAKVDTVPVFEGRQNLLKSSAMRMLAVRDEWYTDHLPDLTSKDAMLQLQGKWLIEIAEFDKLGKVESNRAKAFMSTATDRFRKPYGKTTQDFPRQCVMAVTLNPGATGYLKDETGNRRYWPMECAVGWAPARKIDIKALQAIRDQLWAEAVHRFERDETWWLTDHEFEKLQAESAEKRVELDAWHSAIEAFLAAKEETTADQIFADCLGVIALKDRTPQMFSRASRVLTVLGWYRARVRRDRPDGNRGLVWVYRRGPMFPLLPLNSNGSGE